MDKKYAVSVIDLERCKSQKFWNLPLDAALSLLKELADLSGYALVVENGGRRYKAYKRVDTENLLIYTASIHVDSDSK